MKIGHIGINVTNLERSIKFYQELFDFEVMHESKEENKKFAFLGNNSILLLTLWEQSDKSFSSTTAGLHHLAFKLKTIEELEEYEKKIEKMNIKKIYENPVSHSETASSGGVFFYDPDGIRLELYVPHGFESCSSATLNAPSCGFF